MKKTVVIFANSIKHGKHCVAGKCINTKQWIRPVSDTSGTELTNEQSKYKNNYGEFVVKPKQNIVMNFKSHSPLINQPDNYLIDNTQWTQQYKITDSEIAQYLDRPESLWGESNLIPYSEISSGQIAISQSLYLVEIQDLNLYIPDQNKRRATFKYNNITYDFPVTDPNFDNIIRNSIQTSGIICVSLGEEFNSSCYKLIANIFIKES